MTNQSEEILNYIKENPGACVEDIVSGTGWNRHLVEVATKLMVEERLIREVGKTEWDDPKFEVISRAEQVIGAITSFVDKINQDLQISTPSKLFGSSPLIKASGFLLPLVTHGLMQSIGLPFPEMIANVVEQEQLLAEIAAIANITTDKVNDFYRSHPFSLEFIKAAIQAGAKLDKEDIERTMEEKSIYYPFGSMGEWVDKNFTPTPNQDFTFIVTPPQ